MSVRRNTVIQHLHISNRGICSLIRPNGAVVSSSPGGGGLRGTDHFQWGSPDSEEVIKQA